MKTLTIIKLDGVLGFDDGEKFTCCRNLQEVAEIIKDEYTKCKINFKPKDDGDEWDMLSSKERSQCLSFLTERGPCVIEVNFS